VPTALSSPVKVTPRKLSDVDGYQVNNR
jgi:hypothetical protein